MIVLTGDLRLNCVCVCLWAQNECNRLEFELVVDCPDEELTHMVTLPMTKAGFTLK